MTRAILRRFERLERQKCSILSGVMRLSAAQLHFRPAPAAWSVLDVLDHLIRVEKALLEAVREHLPSGAPLTFRDRVRAWLLTAVMLTPIRVKVPASASVVWPERTADLPEAAASWDDVRGRMANLLGSLQPEQRYRGLFRHPVSGWMTMADALAFLAAHLRHHEYQLNRLKSAVERL
jgi:uncharacterized damage-inducible protein DinB